MFVHKTPFRADEMAYQVREPAAKTEDLSSMPRTHTMERKKQLPKVVL